MAQQPIPIEVGGHDFDASYFGVGVEDRCGVKVLTGSGGGRADSAAPRIAAMGYNVLSLAYYDRSGSQVVPQTQMGFENRHQASLTNLAAVSKARIKVENIRGRYCCCLEIETRTGHHR